MSDVIAFSVFVLLLTYLLIYTAVLRERIIKLEGRMRRYDNQQNIMMLVPGAQAASIASRNQLQDLFGKEKP